MFFQDSLRPLAKRLRHGKRPGAGWAAWLGLLTLLLGSALPLQADTFVVSSADDSGPGSLREAILAANAHPGPDTIVFQLQPAIPTQLSLLTPLPPITDTVTIDGTTQAGYLDTPLIEIEGSAVEDLLNDGLTVRAPNCVLRGLAISRFGLAGILLEAQAANCRVERCYIGTDFGNILALGCSYGIALYDVPGAVLERNVIVANGIGILLSGTTSGIQIRNNIIGADRTGTVPMGNGTGIQLEASHQNVLQDNLISGNIETEISLQLGASNNRIERNFIGLDNYLLPMPGGLRGIDLQQGGSNLLIENWVVGHQMQGIRIWGQNARNNTSTGNLLLLNVHGLTLEAGASQNRIGGSSEPERNRMEGNLIDGLYLADAGTEQNQIIGNDLCGNFANGVTVLTSNNALTGNRIYANGVDGVSIGKQPGRPAANRVTLRSNQIFENGDLGIRLASSGSNNNQPAPEIVIASTNLVRTVVISNLKAEPSTTYEIQFFLCSNPDPSGLGEGDIPIWTTTETTDAQGNATLVTRIPPLPLGLFVTATATDPNGNTSDFSRAEQEVIEAPVSGRVNFYGISDAAPEQEVTFEFRVVGRNGVVRRTAMVGPDGLFSFDDIPTRVYDLMIRSPRYLQRVVPVDVPDTGIAGVATTLLPGDIFQDNIIDLFDLIELFSAYGAALGDPQWADLADLNLDHIVDLFDLILLFENYGVLGDP
jgi:parallel beta-helix repeat protein